MSTTLALIVLLPFLGSLGAAFLPSHARNAAAWLAGITSLGCVVLLVGLYAQVASGEVVRWIVPWMPTFGLEFNFRLDGYAWLFAMLVAVMGALVVLYARYYMSSADPVPRFFSFLLAFMGAMLGIGAVGQSDSARGVLGADEPHVVHADRLLVSPRGRAPRRAHGADRHGRRRLVPAARRADARRDRRQLRTRSSCSPRATRFARIRGMRRCWCWSLLGAFTKSAQFPFHFWLPQAMAAPTPVSAYLHSATMVKAGVFLLARLWPALHGHGAVVLADLRRGRRTLLIGAFSATFQRDMKGVLAYSTISHLGLITLLLGMNSALALVAAVFHMMNHATFKASLFMAAGIVDHETGTRDLKRLSGLRALMPITATLATVAAAAMAGVPLLNGFLSKEMFFAETMFAGGEAGLRFALPVVATLAGVFSVAYSLRFIHRVFFGPPREDLPRTPQEPTRWMLVPSAMLVIACLLVGVFPAQTVGPFLEMAARVDSRAATAAYSWRSGTASRCRLLMSVIALAGGIALYLR